MKILFADDEVSLQELMQRELPGMGHTVAVCPDGLTAIAVLEKDSFDCLFVDLDMPGATGLQVIEAAKERCPDADSIILTGKGTLDTAIAALREGVSDYLTKPCRLAEIERVLNRVAEKRELTRKYKAVKEQLRRVEGKRQLMGSSVKMEQVQRLIDRIAPTDSTVVILGETGTGKELVAKAIHERSRRAEQPFVAVNCGALPENLIESELFGHRKGSFTGAEEHRTGLFQVANGGTLFLDEIGELPKGVQAKLLRFLESGEVRRIGENTSTICDVRVVCATLKDLESMVSRSEFREDLWFRINTFEIKLPPLRERLDDLPELILHLVGRYKSGLCSGKGLKTVDELFSPDALNMMYEYDWPGNVRQLANAIEYSFILADSFPIGSDVLPQSIRNPKKASRVSLAVHNWSTEQSEELEERGDESGNERREHGRRDNEEQVHDRVLRRPDRPITRVRDIPVLANGVTSNGAVANGILTNGKGEQGVIDELLSFDPKIPDSGKTLRDLEMDAIQAALQRNEGNKAKAAEELGISLKTLYNKLNQPNEAKKAG